MKNLIRKILKEENLKQNLKQQVKDYGWKDAAELVNGPENLVKLGFDNNPMNFLNMFNDLGIVQSKENPDWTLFRYKKGNNVMIYDRKNEYVYVSYVVIWSFLENGFGLNYSETEKLTQKWLSEVYNLSGVTTSSICNWEVLRLSEVYNLSGVTTSAVSTMYLVSVV